MNWNKLTVSVIRLSLWFRKKKLWNVWSRNDTSFQSKWNAFKLYRNAPEPRVYNCKQAIQASNFQGYDRKDQDLTCVTWFYYTQAILPFPAAHLLSNARIKFNNLYSLRVSQCLNSYLPFTLQEARIANSHRCLPDRWTCIRCFTAFLSISCTYHLLSKNGMEWNRWP